MNNIGVWKTYPEYPFIEASRFGEIRTIDRYVTDKRYGKRFVKGHILKQYRHRKGYLLVAFRLNGKLVNLRVHRVIASCFLKNPLGLPEVNHRDCNPSNNHLSNLEWCSGDYNIAYREKYGKALSCPLYAVNLKTLEVLRFKTQSEAGRELGVSNSSISNALKGRCNHVGGYWFVKADSNATEATRNKFGDIVANQVDELMNELQPA